MDNLTPTERAELQEKRERLRDDLQWRDKAQALENELKRMQERYSSTDTPQAIYDPQANPPAPAAPRKPLPRLPLFILIGNMVILTVSLLLAGIMTGITLEQGVQLLAASLIICGFSLGLYWVQWRFYWWYRAIQWSIVTVIWAIVIVAAATGVIGLNISQILTQISTQLGLS